MAIKVLPVLKQAIADILKQERKKAGLSQEKTAMLAGISVRYYQDIEAANKLASLEIIYKLSAALGCHYTAIQDPVWKYWVKQNKDCFHD